MISTEPLFVADNVVVFADHADKHKFWYLPGTVAIAKRAEDGKAIFSFIKYRDSEVTGDKDAVGGYLMFEVSLALPAKAKATIEARLRGFSATATLVPVAFDDGTVSCTVLGTTSRDTAENASGIRVVGAVKPSLMGDNNAMFACELDAKKATLLMEALSSDAQVLGVLYELNYTAMPPPSRAHVALDFKRVLTQLDARLGVEAQVKVALDAEIGAMFRDLQSREVIKITTEDPLGTPDSKKAIDAAVEWVKEYFINEFFKPVLTIPDPRIRNTPGKPPANKPKETNDDE